MGSGNTMVGEPLPRSSLCRPAARRRRTWLRCWARRFGLQSYRWPWVGWLLPVVGAASGVTRRGRDRLAALLPGLRQDPRIAACIARPSARRSLSVPAAMMLACTDLLDGRMLGRGLESVSAFKVRVAGASREARRFRLGVGGIESSALVRGRRGRLRCRAYLCRAVPLPACESAEFSPHGSGAHSVRQTSRLLYTRRTEARRHPSNSVHHCLKIDSSLDRHASTGKSHET